MIVPRTVVSAEQVVDARHVVNMLFVDDKIAITSSISCSRRVRHRGGVGPERLCSNRRFAPRYHALTLAARAMAFLNGRTSSLPQDVKTVAWMYCATGCR